MWVKLVWISNENWWSALNELTNFHPFASYHSFNPFFPSCFIHPCLVLQKREIFFSTSFLLKIKLIFFISLENHLNWKLILEGSGQNIIFIKLNLYLKCSCIYIGATFHYITYTFSYSFSFRDNYRLNYVRTYTKRMRTLNVINWMFFFNFLLFLCKENREKSFTTSVWAAQRWHSSWILIFIYNFIKKTLLSSILYMK